MFSQPTSIRIKEALIHIANEQKRPHFSMYIVRQVIFAFKNEINHPLKPQVLKAINDLDHKEIFKQSSEITINKREIIKEAYIQKKLHFLFQSNLLDEHALVNAIRGREEISDQIWNTVYQTIR